MPEPRQNYRNHRYHQSDHQSALGNMALQSQSLEVWGAIAGLRWTAGMTRQELNVTDGSLMFGSVKRAKREDVITWLASRPQCSRQKAVIIFDAMKYVGELRVAPKSGIVTLPKWKKEQEDPRTRDAGYQRAHRDAKDREEAINRLQPIKGRRVSSETLIEFLCTAMNKKRPTIVALIQKLTASGVLAKVGVDSFDILPLSVGLPCGSPPPASTTDDNPTTYDSDMSDPSVLTCQTEVESRVESREESEIPSTCRLSTAGGGEPQGTASGPGSQSLAILLRDDPVGAACMVTETSLERDVKTYGAKLRDLKKAYDAGPGTHIFCDEVRKLAAERQPPRPEHETFRRQGKLPVLLTSRLKKWVDRKSARDAIVGINNPVRKTA